MGVDSNGAPFTLFQDVKVSGLGSAKPQSIKKAKQPFKVALPEQEITHFDIDLTFAGHYNEPGIKLKVFMEELI